MPRPRAIIFDLDDTLYPYEWFVQSGFAAASAWLSDRLDIPKQTALDLMRRARDEGERGREFQRVCHRLQLPVSLVPALVRIVHQHDPKIHLPEESQAALKILRRTWRVGVLTNGLPEVQKRKVRALGLDADVDAIVYAADCGSGLGKPDPAAFHEMLDRLDVAADRTVLVGDDPIADIHGAGVLGIRTIHLSANPGEWPEGVMPPDALVRSIYDVPRAADHLMPQEWANVA
jgi:putative hydrolase of the HAD superfamily